jgi:hypothetical protein
VALHSKTKGSVLGSVEKEKGRSDGLVGTFKTALDNEVGTGLGLPGEVIEEDLTLEEGCGSRPHENPRRVEKRAGFVVHREGLEWG